MFTCSFLMEKESFMAYRTREQMQAETELAKRQSILEVAIANGYSFTKKGNYYIDDENLLYKRHTRKLQLLKESQILS